MVVRYFGTAILAAGVIAASSNWAMADHGQLSGDEIKTTLVGAKLKGESSRGKPYRVRYREDGTVSMSMEDNSFADKGKWWVDGTQYCAQWKKIRKGAPACWHVNHRAGVKYFFEGIDGATDTEAVITK